MFRHPHLDAHIGAVQPLEGLFVGDVVAEEHRGGRTLLMAQDVEGLALIRGDDGELENLLALGDLRAPAVCDGECLSQGGVGVLLGCVAHVERDTGRFQFDGHPGYSAAMADSLVAMVFNSALASPSMACTKPASNSEP